MTLTYAKNRSGHPSQFAIETETSQLPPSLPSVSHPGYAPVTAESSQQEAENLIRTSAGKQAAPDEGQRSSVRTPGEVRVTPVRKWVGRVLEVDAESGFFVVELTGGGLTHPVVADFTLSSLAEEDQPVPGDIVYVTSREREVVGFRGRRETATAVRLQRLGVWTHDEVLDEVLRVRAMRPDVLGLFE